MIDVDLGLLRLSLQGFLSAEDNVVLIQRLFKLGMTYLGSFWRSELHIVPKLE